MRGFKKELYKNSTPLQMQTRGKALLSSNT